LKKKGFFSSVNKNSLEWYVEPDNGVYIEDYNSTAKKITFTEANKYDIYLLYKTAVGSFNLPYQNVKKTVDVRLSESLLDPVAVLNIPKSEYFLGDEVLLDASKSFDPNELHLNSEIETYKFISNLDGEILSTGNSKVSTFDLSEGEHEITLTVISSKGLSKSVKQTVKIVKNLSPVAKLKVENSSYLSGDTVYFDFSESKDEDGIIENYKLVSDIDGELCNGTDPSLSISSLLIGSHKLTLTVTDDYGNSAEDQVLVNIQKERDTTKPTLTIDSNMQNAYYIGDTFLVKASAEDSGDGLKIARFNMTNSNNEVVFTKAFEELNGSKSETFEVSGNFENFETGVYYYTFFIKDMSDNLDDTTVKGSFEIKEKIKGKPFLNIPQSFTRNHYTDIVTDLVTGLKWEDTEHVKNIDLNYSNAVEYCENLTLGGIRDWRVPTLKELWYLHDRSIYNPALNSTFENYKTNSHHNIWTSTSVTYSGYESRNWVLDSYCGSDGWVSRTDSNYIRCVSGISDYEFRNIEFERNDNINTILDKRHNLIWQNDSSSSTYNYSEAQSYCSNLIFGGYSDWRLPEIEELYSITDQSKTSSPYVNYKFKNIKSDWYRSNTTKKSNNSNSWGLSFVYGDDYNYGGQNNGYSVVCVRDME
jgi:hypothetical protein